MPYPGTHLYVADRLLLGGLVVRNAGLYYLGALAPDAVHFRQNYTGAHKYDTHLCVGNKAWGEAWDDVANIMAWCANALAFLREAIHGSQRDFSLGYASHILLDIENTLRLWGPLRRAHPKEIVSARVHLEEPPSDDALLQQYARKPMIFAALAAADPAAVQCPHIATAELAAIHDSILYKQYAKPLPPYTGEYRLVPPAMYLRFVRDALDAVAEQLKPVLPPGD